MAMADITVIGGINIDIEGRPFEALKYEDSNPGSITLSYGGVGRNITENIARLGVDVSAKAELKSMGVDVSCVEVLKGRNSAMYLSVLNDKNDMEIALCDMDIVKIITPEFLEKKKDVLQNSKVIAVDGNLTEETLDYVTANFPNAKLFFDQKT
jgi:pseudouridine kinase